MPDRGTTIDSLMMGQADSGYVFEIRLEAALLPRLKVQVLIVDAKCVGDQLVAGVVVPLHRQLRRHVAGRTNLHPGGCTLEPSPWAVIEFDGGSPNSVDLPDARCEMLKDSTAGSAPKNVAERGKLFARAPFVDVQDDMPWLVRLIRSIRSRHNHESVGHINVGERAIHDTPRQNKIADAHRHTTLVSTWTDNFAVARLEVPPRHLPRGGLLHVRVLMNGFRELLTNCLP